jgi:hypothetical protein
MGASLELKIAPFRVAGIIVFQRAVDIDWQRVVPFDEIGIVAVQRNDNGSPVAISNFVRKVRLSLD